MHRVYPGVYAVGRPQLTHKGRWMAAVLACGAGAVLSHESAAALSGLRNREGGRIHVWIPRDRNVRIPGITVHRRSPGALADATTCDRIPVTGPVRTLVDLGASAGRREIEALITAVQQARDTVRDNAHQAAGLTAVRFTHAHVAYEPDYVERTLAALARTLRRPHTNSASQPDPSRTAGGHGRQMAKARTSALPPPK